MVSQQHFWPRRQTQYHFHNRGYRSFDDFLADLRSHRRNTIRRERRELSEAGITVQTHAGLCNDETAPPVTDGKNRGFTWAELDQMFAMYLGTSVRYTGEAPFLNQSFFRLCSERLGDQLELVLARNRDGNLIAGAWNLRGTTRRFGRYWGESVPIRFCILKSAFITRSSAALPTEFRLLNPATVAIRSLLRGFRPTYTYSAHFFSHSNLHQVIGKYLQKSRFSSMRCVVLNSSAVPCARTTNECGKSPRRGKMQTSRFPSHASRRPAQSSERRARKPKLHGSQNMADYLQLRQRAALLCQPTI